MNRAFFAALFLGAAGCSGITAPDRSDELLPPPVEPGPKPPRVLVLNSLSETISSLDLESHEMTVQAATAGQWPNRFVDVPARTEILVVASGENEVQILDRTTLTERRAIDVGPGHNPWAVALRDASRGLVTNWLSGTVMEIDVASTRASSPLPTTPGPEGLLVQGSRAFVACTNYHGPSGTYLEGRVDVVDFDVWSVVASIPVSVNPQEVVRAPDGRLHVLCTGTNGTGPVPQAGAVTVIDPTSLDVVGSVAIGGSPGRLVFGAGDVGWVAGFEGGVRRYDAASLTVLPPPPETDLGATGFSAIVRDEAAGTIYVANFDLDLLIAIDEATATIEDAWIVGDGPIDLIVLR